MVKLGEVALKIAGRDAGQLCVVVDVLDNGYVFVDGLTRRRKCNIKHLEFVGANVKIKKNADTKEVVNSLRENGFNFKEVKKAGKREKKVKPVAVKKEEAKVKKSIKKK